MPVESALPRLEEQGLVEDFLENDTVMESYRSKGNGEEGVGVSTWTGSWKNKKAENVKVSGPSGHGVKHESEGDLGKSRSS